MNIVARPLKKSTNSVIKLCTWNVNGIRASLRKNALQDFIQVHKPQILCLQEIKATPHDVNLTLTPVMDDFHIIWNPATRKGYSGTLVMVNKHIQESNLKILDKKLGMDVNLEGLEPTAELPSDNEGRVTFVEFPKFSVVNVYTPNAKEGLERLPYRQKWDASFTEHISKLRQLKPNKPILVCGDLNVAHKNIDLARPAPNKGKAGFTEEEKLGLQNFFNSGYVDAFRHKNGNVLNKYTWWSPRGSSRANNVGWRIDYWAVEDAFKNQIIDCQINDDVVGSDHCPVTLNFEVGK